MSVYKPLKRLYREAKGISPLVATLLLIAIAVAASVITYSWVMSMIAAQSIQAQTQIRIDAVGWVTGPNRINITVRNTGSVPATIESISLKKNAPGQNYVLDDITDVSIEPGDYTFVVYDASVWAAATPYIIRVTCTTGFYYEAFATSP